MFDGGFVQWIPSLVAIVMTVVVVVAVRALEARIWSADASEQKFRKQVYTAGILLVGMLVVIFLLPEGSNQDLAFGVIGLVVTGALAISSQSIIANGMAGLLLRSLEKFKPGDFIEVNERVGRVTELGLFHTEIQTNDRDLTTIPNSLMVNQPVKVVRASGTIVSANISIGYDVSRHRLTPLLIEAAERVELTDPFVQVVDLGDYSVVYRVAGFLGTPERLLAVRSKLRGAMLDVLHESGIEIMSPMYVATRDRSREVSIPSRPMPTDQMADDHEHEGERRIFDKAEIAGTIEAHRTSIARAEERIAELAAHKDAGVEGTAIHQRIEATRRRIEQLTVEIGDLEKLLRDN